MSNPEPEPKERGIERLREALEAETGRRFEAERLLNEANAGFEHFVLLAAHNFCESLREVNSHSQLLAEACSGNLDPEAAAGLAHIRAGTAKMQALIADVLDYWSGDDLSPSPTDMGAVLAEAIRLTAPRIAQRGAIVTHGALPLLQGDFGVLTKVLHHLIRNAIDYCAAPVPRVHIAALQEGGHWVILVKDNGPGVEPAFQERVFGVFQRLHGREHPGNGLGLAFCRRAIERLGGRIAVDSAPGEGSCFRFTLPAG